MALIRRLSLAVVALLAMIAGAHAQIQGGSAYLYCWTGSAWQVCSATNPLTVTFSSGIGTLNNNILQWNSVNLGSPTTWGTPPTGLTVIGVNADVLSLPSLPSGSNTIGAVTQASGPWTVSQSGTWTVTQGSPPWSVSQSNGPWTSNITQWATTSLGAPTTWGTPPTGLTVIGVNADVLSLPSLPAGGNTIGAVTQASGPWTSNITQWDTTALGAPTAWGAAPSGNVIGANVNVVAGTVATTLPVLSTVACSALCANQIIKGSAGSIFSFTVSADGTLSAAAWWIMIYNATSAPSDGSVTPAKCYAMPSGVTNFSAAFAIPVPLSTGITIGVSTTGCFTKTASTHAFISGDFQ